MRLGALVLGLLLFTAMPAMAADVDGKWSGNLTTPNGDVIEYLVDGENRRQGVPEPG